jgi:hypothetical protein
LSCGISGTGETPKGAKRQEAHRLPRGKRAPGAEINHSQKQQGLRKQPRIKRKPFIRHKMKKGTKHMHMRLTQRAAYAYFFIMELYVSTFSEIGKE